MSGTLSYRASFVGTAVKPFYQLVRPEIDEEMSKLADVDISEFYDQATIYYINFMAYDAIFKKKHTNCDNMSIDKTILFDLSITIVVFS